LDFENVRVFKSFRKEFFSFPDGTVFWEEHFDATFSAEFYLRRFPFDSQSLYIVVQPTLSPSRPNHELVEFEAQNYALGINADTYLAAWEIEGISYSRELVPISLTGLVVPQAQFKISVTRRSGFYIWQVFLPTLLMVTIPWSVFWIKINEFDWQMKIPLTVML